MTKKRALILAGGWDGHAPDELAAFAARKVFDDFDITIARDLSVITPRFLDRFAVLAPIWTFGELDREQERTLLDAVANGLGVVAWHGAASAFLASRAHKFMLGGQFVAHPGDLDVTYTVRFRDDDALSRGLEDVTVTSEQYYLLVDPAVKVLATTMIDGGALPWTRGVEMPVAWRRDWGRGRVFYCSLGHTVDTLAPPPVTTLLRRAAAWASGRTISRRAGDCLDHAEA